MKLTNNSLRTLAVAAVAGALLVPYATPASAYTRGSGVSITSYTCNTNNFSVYWDLSGGKPSTWKVIEAGTSTTLATGRFNKTQLTYGNASISVTLISGHQYQMGLTSGKSTSFTNPACTPA